MGGEYIGSRMNSDDLGDDDPFPAPVAPSFYPNSKVALLNKDIGANERQTLL